MTHKISLMPGGCTGGCEAEMATLKGRLARLEREMSSLKDKCPCSENCPNDCSGNGECEKGKCVCQQGFVGPDCTQCALGAECNNKAIKGKTKVTVETLQVNKDRENMQEKTTKAEHMLFQKREQKKGADAKETDTKSKVATDGKAGVIKTQTKKEASAKKINVKGSSSATKTSHPTVGQVLLKHEGRKQEEARKGKTTVLATKKVAATNKTRAGKESLEQSTLAEKNVTQSPGQKQIKTVKVDTINVQSVDNRKPNAGKTGKGKATQRSQYVVNATVGATSDENKVLQNNTTIHGSTRTRRIGGSGLGSVKNVNISSYSFTVMWSAPQGMFKNFTVVRREPSTEGDEDEHEELEEEALEGDRTRNTTEVLVQSEITNTTASSGKAVGSRGRSETKRISMVVPGSVRSVEFSNLRANTRYVLHIYGTAAERRSKIHRVTATTGPEPATEMVFSNVTDSSFSVSWSKPKTVFTGFRVSYTNIVTGESRFLTVDSQQSSVALSELSAGTSYIITVTTTQGRAQSDALASVITTVPAPPTHLQVVNVTDTRAVLQWTPSLGKVDRFIISYESSKTPNVTVTVMLSGNSVEHQLRGLQRGTLYTVKVLSQKDSLQSMAISTTFTTANVVKASEVGARFAVITWRTTVIYHSYRVIYQVAGEETKELILEPTLTEYKLTGLLPMSRYIVVVQGERDGHYTSVVTSEFITGKLRFPFPTECSQELLNGALQSGELDIYPQGKEGRAVRVYCDMETDGGGWTVFQRRMNGKTDFYRTWSEYSAGFGNLSEEFWLGNELLHNLTSVGPMSLRVDMRSGNDTAYAHYSNFSTASEEMLYALTVSGYTGTAGDSMRYHNGRPFSARDKDPDSLGIHCARAYMGGWWYKNCYKTNLNGLYAINSNNQGVVWIDWKGKDSSIPFTEMKFRPSRFSPATHG
ncbi:tenascin-like [Brachyistius frenatus]|uniref:tenascin-like n=1 Tax=Brachyistius frenatus TaxID=100188 RepID=UPI0037E777F7